MAIKTYIDQEKLKKLLENNYSAYQIHNMTGYPISAIYRIKSGKQVDRFISRANLRVEPEESIRGNRSAVIVDFIRLKTETGFYAIIALKTPTMGA